MSSPFDQSRYQVRFEWGIDGLARLAPADVVIVVDVLRFSTTVTDAVARGIAVPLDADADAVSINGARVARAAAASGALVVLGCLRNAAAVGRLVLAEQQRRARRASVAVIAAGELVEAGESAGTSIRFAGQGAGTSMRFAIEDLLGAGAVVQALVDVGIDHSSPEAAVASEAFGGLQGALRHLLTASGSGQELIARDRRDEVLTAAELDAVDTVPVLRDGTFHAF